MIDHSYFFRFKIYSTQSSPSSLVFLLENHFFTNLSFKQFCFIFHFIRMWDFIKRSLQTFWSFAQDLISNALMRCQCQILQILNYFHIYLKYDWKARNMRQMYHSTSNKDIQSNFNIWYKAKLIVGCKCSLYLEW